VDSANQKKSTEYLRVQIRGHLVVCSPLHIGTGDIAEITEIEERKNLVKNIEGEKSPSYLTVCLNHKQQPYLPASTLRGFLAGIAKKNEAFHKKLFGYGAIKEKGGDAGCLRVYDAHWLKLELPETSQSTTLKYRLPGWDSEKKTGLRSQVSINPITATVEEHQLFTQEIVPPGSVFDFYLEAEQITSKELNDLLGLLASWDGVSSQASLGKGRSKGQGILCWTPDEVKILNKEKLAAWLKGEVQEQELPYEIYKEHTISSNWQQSNAQTWQFFLYPQSPFLVRDPWYPESASGTEKEAVPAEYSRYPDDTANGRAMIPASTLMGWIRGRARRILLTVLASQHADELPTLSDTEKNIKILLDTLFGSTDQRSAIWIQDAVAPITKRVSKQDFIAIDRFTGGVATGDTDKKGETKKGGKLYAVNSAFCDYLKSTLTLHDAQLSENKNIGQFLLLLILRDALEDGIVIGWGKGRGYGVFSLAVCFDHEEITSWDDFYKKLPDSFKYQLSKMSLSDL